MVNRPKRRKHRDNPYTLECMENNKYIVSFKNGNRTEIVEVSESVYKALDRFELDDIKEMHEFERHIEHSEIYEESLYKKAMDKPMELEDFVIQKSSFGELKKAIEMLPEVQKRRIKKYYFDDKNEYQIAIEENTTQQAVNKSLLLARKKLKEILKK